jgi:hypothetical protein
MKAKTVEKDKLDKRLGHTETISRKKGSTSFSFSQSLSLSISPLFLALFYVFISGWLYLLGS